jgi:hypothetical protein
MDGIEVRGAGRFETGPYSAIIPMSAGEKIICNCRGRFETGLAAL